MDSSFVFACGWWLGIAALGARANGLVLVALLVEVGMVLGVLLVIFGVVIPLTTIVVFSIICSFLSQSH